MTEHFFRPTVKIWAKEVDANPIVKECDYLFFPLGAQLAPYMSIKNPFIYLSDATEHLMMDYYRFNISPKSKRMAIALDTKVCKNAFISIRSSQWAINSVIHDCNCDEDRCFVLEFGPKIDIKDIKKSQPYKGGQLRIFFFWCRLETKGR